MIRHICLLLLGFFCCAPALAYTNLSESCPDRFQIVDFGIWDGIVTGTTTRRFGGVLIDVGIQDKADDYFTNSYVSCLAVPNDYSLIPYRDGLPVALVASVTLKTVRSKNLRKAIVSNYGTAETAYETLEQDDVRAFGVWEEQARRKDSGITVVHENGYACMFATTNSDLFGEGYGNYTCLLSIDGMPNKNTYVNCNKWNGCIAEFSFLGGLAVRMSVPLPKNLERADVPRGVREVVAFWTEHILVFRSTFEDAIIPRDDSIALEKR